MLLANAFNETHISAQLMTTQLKSSVSQQCLQFRYKTNPNTILRCSACVDDLVNLSRESLLAHEFL